MVNEPHGGESRPLRRQCHSMWQEGRRPCEKHRQSTDGESFPPELSAEFGELHTPVDGTQERENDSTIGDLYGFNGVKQTQSVGEVGVRDTCGRQTDVPWLSNRDLPLAAREASRAKTMVATEVPKYGNRPAAPDRQQDIPMTRVLC